MEVRDIQSELRSMVEPDGYNVAEVIDDLAADYGFPREDIVAIWDGMNRL